MTSLPSRKVVSTSSIGLDIGSSAVRAAEVTKSRRGTALRRFAQVGLPRGAVTDGEIRDPGAVVAAVRRLWSEGGFSSRNVVLAVSGRQVIVRQAEVPAMSAGDFRSALNFQAMDLIPIPVDEASLDFLVLPGPAGGRQSDRMQILLAAAHRSVIDSYLGVLRQASLRPVALDPVVTSVLRATQRATAGAGGAVAVVDVGSDLTMIAVGDGGRVRFSRILGSGGGDLTDNLASRLRVAHAEAETLKRYALADTGPGTLLTRDVDPLVSEIVSSLSFFADQMGTDSIEGVLLTGGGSREPELLTQLTRRQPRSVTLLDALEGLDCAELDLDTAGMASASGTALVAVGAAQWTFEQPSRRLSLLPRELAKVAAARRHTAFAAAGIAVLAIGLVGLSVHRSKQVSAAKADAATVVASNAAVQRQIADLSTAQQVTSAVQSRLTVLQSDQSGNVAWMGLVDEITRSLPPGAILAGITLNGVAGSSASGTAPAASTSASSSSTAAAGGNGPLGSVSMSVKMTGNLDQVAVWLRAVRAVPGLEGVSVMAASESGGQVTFTSSAGVSARAPLVQRSAVGAGGS